MNETDWQVGTVFRFPSDQIRSQIGGCCSSSRLSPDTKNIVVYINKTKTDTHILWKAEGCKKPGCPSAMKDAPPHCNGWSLDNIQANAEIVEPEPVIEKRNRFELILEEIKQ